MVNFSRGMHFETPLRLNFRLYALLTSWVGVLLAHLSGVKSLTTIHNGNICYFSIYNEYTPFSRSKIGSKMMVSGLTHLLGRVKRSYVLKSKPDSSSDDVGGFMSSVPR